MTLFSFYGEAYQSITDFGSYRKRFTQSILRSVIYLLLLASHTALAWFLALAIYQLPEMTRLVQWASEHFPTMIVRDGRMSLEESEREEPIVLRYLGDEILTVVFDTTGETQTHLVEKPAVVFSREQLLLLFSEQPQTWPWTSFGWLVREGRIDQRELIRFQEALPWLFVATLPALLLAAILQLVVLGVIISFFSFLASSRQGVRLPFGNCFTIALYSLTPAVTLEIVLKLTALEFPSFGTIYLATAAIFAYQATQRCVVIE